MTRAISILLLLCLNTFSFNYFPLQKGNYWVYTGTDTSGEYLKIKHEIIDELIISSAAFYIFTNSYFDSLGNSKTISKDTLDKSLLEQWSFGYLSLDTLIPQYCYYSDTSYHRIDTINGFTFLGKQYNNVVMITYTGDDYSNPNGAVNVHDVFIDSIGWIKRDANSKKHPNLLTYSLTEWKTQFSEFNTSIKIQYMSDNGRQFHIMYSPKNIYHTISIDLLGRTINSARLRQFKMFKTKMITGQDKHVKLKVLLY